MPKLFVDLDGVLADFDRHHEAVFGFRSCKVADNVDWKAVRAVPDFYLNIPPMEDLDALWARIERYSPVVLTGVPSSVEEAPDNKRAWVRKNLGDHVEVRCVRSKEKYLHCTGSDSLLIDDWEKYKHLWEGAGGRWITHVSASETARQLDVMGL